MEISKSLFESESICLASIDHEKDPEIESKWTHDANYWRMLTLDPVRPLSPAQLKKKYEAIEKEMEEKRGMFYFTIRMRADDRLIGFVKLSWVEWTNGNADLQMGIGEAEERGKGYGWQALGLVMRYAFAELNLHRLSTVVPEYNQVALHLLQKAGFIEEVRRRQAINRDGQRWDLLHYGILRQEWEGRS
jgi:RimJ/RimL family protein N-acetyltransferase